MQTDRNPQAEMEAASSAAALSRRRKAGPPREHRLSKGQCAFQRQIEVALSSLASNLVMFRRPHELKAALRMSKLTIL